MAMGHFAAFAITIEDTNIKKLGLNSYEKFLETMKLKEVSLDEFASCIETESIERLKESEIKELLDEYDGMYEVALSYIDFVKEFYKKHGVRIRLGYHDSDNYGDRYDEVHGAFYSLIFEDVFQKTKEIKKLEDKLGTPCEISHFVVFG